MIRLYHGSVYKVPEVQDITEWYFKAHSSKKEALKLLLDWLAPKSKILSLGCGEGVLELELAKAGHDVLAIDSNPLAMNGFKLNPGLCHWYPFDFTREDVSLLGKFDVAVFFGASYVMNNQQFIKVFKSLNAPKVWDFQAGTGSFWKLLKLAWCERNKDKTKSNGFIRHRYELRKLYRTAGYTIVSTHSLGGYGYIAQLAKPSS